MNIIILAGGSGARLWPQSRAAFPKQFLRLFGEESLLQKTVRRFLAAFSVADLAVVTQKDLVHLVALQLEEIDPSLKERIVVEPDRSNTMPALMAGIDWLRERGELAECFLVAPSDHLIAPVDRFLERVHCASEMVRSGHHALFGVRPTSPHTGYGYIEFQGEGDVADVVQFLEKPREAKAMELIEQGNCLWNSGIFLFHREKLLADWEGREVPSLSIDHAYLEEANGLKVLPLDLTWSDVGSWDSVYEEKGRDADRNVFCGDVEQIGTHGCLVLGKKRLVGLIDVEDLLIVDEEDALLIARRGSSEKVRELVGKLGNRQEVQDPRTTHRPWGSYTVLEEGTGYKIKRIVVSPAQKLSLQYHHHRSEHWVVIEGRANIQLGQEQAELRKNESLFVPRGTVHRLENPLEEPLEIIEVQVGDYVGEDDIVRLDDVYGRLETTFSNT